LAARVGLYDRMLQPPDRLSDNAKKINHTPRQAPSSFTPSSRSDDLSGE
jgi:hypothetical protein